MDSRRRVRGRGGQIRAVPATHLVAGRDGGPHAGQRADTRRDDGHGGRVPCRALLPRLPSVAGDDDDSRHCRRIHRHIRGVNGACRQRRQARFGVFHREPARIHDAGARIGRLRLRHIPPVHACLLQGAAVLGIGVCEPRIRHFRHALHGRIAEGHALDIFHLPNRRLGAGGGVPHRRILEQG